MVAGWQRLNEKTSQPNPNIVFIKPLKGPDQKIAQDFLERIAAQCRPLMREHHLYVTSLEEYEPNREFVGRNFNAGEVVQLVLKSPGMGRWLPFDYVQMVMMHELAHCKQMNHSRAFWAVRDSYASEMHALWAKGYTGDGLWGRGAALATGKWEGNTVGEGEVLPEHLCGGTFRSRGRKRRVKPKLTYKEQKERRILKKFGRNGTALGADEEAKVKLEKGKRVQAKPRVAGSARGRELRAAAALARFGKQKEETPPKEEDVERESDSESEYEDEEALGPDVKDAVDLDGSRLLDGRGREMVRVCEGEEEDIKDNSAKNEAWELQDMLRRIKREVSDEPALGSLVDIKRESETAGEASTRRVKSEPTDTSPTTAIPPRRSDDPRPKAPNRPKPDDDTLVKTEQDTACPMCSFSNPRGTFACAVCANVLSDLLSGGDGARAWRCRGESCRNTSYRNADDCGVCGLCGQRRRGEGL